MSNTSPVTSRTITRPCVVCGDIFTAPIKRGPLRARCDKHWYRALRPKRALAKPVEPPQMVLLPVTGIAIARQCRCCRRGFIAHHEAALYCDLNCYVRDRKREPIPDSQKANLCPHPRARVSAEDRL